MDPGPADRSGATVVGLRLRALAETELGGEFDLVGFHDVALGNGSLPLEVLGRLVEEWVAGGD